MGSPLPKAKKSKKFSTPFFGSMEKYSILLGLSLLKIDAEEMIEEIKAQKILEGARGMPRADKDTIISTLLATSKMLVECPEIKELDMNPMLVYEKGARIVDARISS